VAACQFRIIRAVAVEGVGEGPGLSTDTSVPVSRIPDFLERAQALIDGILDAVTP
jgi:hypothetical protein